MTESEQLNQLGELHRSGVLSDEEFARAKARVLAGNAQHTPSGSPIVDAVNGLRRSRDDRWVGGVCGGLAMSTGLAAWAWRLLFVLLFVCGGTGLLVYLLMWWLVPLAPSMYMSSGSGGNFTMRS
ncbi:PspC domain-containing protein [Ideonella azotifigens]|uniref:PspC domain-containing protein n=1 Tax=Ideonella azotifigens TaxID=513160 RepID=A0ABN1JRU5_9BURK|nr:PspC domain-containing protein [Ideonella azotifigens]MCD2340267.1 PspC domain-containing protein [Ideonella azotifigens]